MKQIILFTDNLGAGGAQRQLVGLAVLLQQAGYRVKVCTYYNIGFYKSYLEENRVENELIIGADDTKRRIGLVRKYFKRENPDWVVAYQETPSLVACIAKALGCKYRLVVSERNTTQHLGFHERIRFFLYHWADSIVPNSFAQKQFLLEHFPWMRSKLTTITNFVDLNHFGYSHRTRREKPLIVVAASIWPSKNTIGLIRAASILRERGEEFVIEWYGIVETHKDYLAQCRNLISEYELDEYIKLLPKTKQIRDKYKECDFFCLPSFYEGTPNVICEAMSCGRPIICSNVCDNPIYVSDCKNGFLFDPCNPTSIADTFQKAFAISPENFERFCAHSRQIAEGLFSEKVFVKKYIKIIERT